MRNVKVISCSLETMISKTERKILLFKSEAFLLLGSVYLSVSPSGTDIFFVNLSKLELSYRLQTLHGDAFSS